DAARCYITHRHFDTGQMAVLGHGGKMLTTETGHKISSAHRPDEHVLQFETGRAETGIVGFHCLKAAAMRINDTVISTERDKLRMTIKALPQRRQGRTQARIEQNPGAAETACSEHG